MPIDEAFAGKKGPLSLQIFPDSLLVRVLPQGFLRWRSEMTSSPLIRAVVASNLAGSPALNRGEEKLDRINTIYLIMIHKIVIIVSILSIMGSIFRHFHVSTV